MRLVYLEELKEPNTFGCVEYGTCSNRYPWIYSVSYWTGTPNEWLSTWAVYSPTDFFSVVVYDDASFLGVRPVIVISKDYFD